MTGHEAGQDPLGYTMWSVFAHRPGVLDDRADAVREAQEAWASNDDGVTVRGLYRVSGLRADADWFVWTHGPSITALQDRYAAFRKTAWGCASTPVWSAAGVHRPAEFSRDHVPAYLRDVAPARFLTVYPFVRSYEWYLLPDDERRDLLINHGAAARPFPDVISNTVSAFALGDYEWILALEAEHLHRLVDVMRAFRGTYARRHVREETPFFTGERTSIDALIADVP